MLTYLTASTVSEIICFIFAIMCLISDRSIVWRSMTLYLLITCITDISGIYFARKYHNNQWIYNIFLVFEICFTNLMFITLFSKYSANRSLIYGGLTIATCFYSYDLFNHSFHVFNNLTYSIMSVVYVIYSLYYYFLLLNNEYYVELKYSPEFWWVAGALFFYFANTACNLFDDKLANVMITGKLNISYFIFKALNIILYSCWSYSFICRKWLSTRTITSKA